MKKKSIFFLLILLISLTGCNGQGSSASELNIGRTQADEITLNPNQLKAWQHFNSENHYRVATADDFKFPPANKPNHVRHWFASGDFNRDRKFSDFALIIVDIRQEQQSRFGLIIFNAREAGVYDPIWLFRDTDLSRTSLNYTSHGPLLIAEYGAGGIDICTVEWDSDEQKYSCE